ncbi:MAG: nitronate monooxygenase [Opitutales bacterium]|nr:nitronate monooxygenase [Opitutales bacterium]
MKLPEIIQGGMGVAVSNWELARSVSSAGQLGVVSSTGIDSVFARRLQDGDPGRHMRMALDHFPIPEVADRILKKYFLEGGRSEGQPYKVNPMGSIDPSKEWEELIVVANFAEVFLAKLGHAREVGINLLEKIQLPTLPSLYGAVLAGVDYVLMGAGIPRAIPGVLDKFSKGMDAQLKLDVKGAAASDNFFSQFNPSRFFSEHLPELKRPRFLGIITSHVLAQTLATKADGHVDGYVVEGPTAGGHNAPPRGAMALDERGEPIYGPRDEPDMAKIRDIGRPFWMAGSYGNPDGLVRAKELGAAGIQVGTAFAFCNESGMVADVKSKIIGSCRRGISRVFTDSRASPTGFPFKVFGLENTMSEDEDYKGRRRVCDLGYLRHLFKKEDGSVGYRCPAEPVDAYLRKGGDAADIEGRKCLCNGLMATIGLGQKRKDGDEKPIVTVGDSVLETIKAIAADRDSYSAADVIRYLRSKLTGEGAASKEAHVSAEA